MFGLRVGSRGGEIRYANWAGGVKLDMTVEADAETA